jgi:DNA-binding NarL/FixJ family response regulator
MSERATVWTRLQKAGLAGEVADAIVKTQPVPERLLRALAALDASPRDARTGTLGELKGRPLSPAEGRVLEDAAGGLTISQSAIRRGVTFETVRTHRRHLLAKLDAANMTQAVAIACRAEFADINARLKETG